MELGIAISHAAAYGNVHAARVRFPGARGTWDRPRAIISLEDGQGGQLYGSGIVLWEAGYPTYGRAGRFAICKHEHKADADANPSRGWHPGRCAKCGLDMTVDSGD